MNKLVLPVLVLLGVIVMALVQGARRGQDASRAGTFRPRAKAWSGQPTVDPATPHVMSRSELAGLRDAYSSAAIDAHQPLRCCCGCQAVYHFTSLQALNAENAGRCAVCSGTAFAEVRLAD
jgi:hypothetical protein